MDNNEVHQVAIVDIKIPFWTMVTLMVKASIAAIPAFIILTIIWASSVAVIAAILTAMDMIPNI